MDQRNSVNPISISDAVAVLVELERQNAQEASTLAQLRAVLMPDVVAASDLIDDWICSGTAAQLANLSNSRITAICRANRFGEQRDGFARLFFGRWQLSRSRFLAHLKSKQK